MVMSQTWDRSVRGTHFGWVQGVEIKIGLMDKVTSLKAQFVILGFR